MCPKCGEEIRYLLAYAERKYYMVVKNNRASYQKTGDDENMSFECPECGEILFTDERDAIKFLDGDVNEV